MIEPHDVEQYVRECISDGALRGVSPEDCAASFALVLFDRDPEMCGDVLASFRQAILMHPPSRIIPATELPSP